MVSPTVKEYNPIMCFVVLSVNLHHVNLLNSKILKVIGSEIQLLSTMTVV